MIWGFNSNKNEGWPKRSRLTQWSTQLLPQGTESKQEEQRAVQSGNPKACNLHPPWLMLQFLCGFFPLFWKTFQRWWSWLCLVRQGGEFYKRGEKVLSKVDAVTYDLNVYYNVLFKRSEFLAYCCGTCCYLESFLGVYLWIAWEVQLKVVSKEGVGACLTLTECHRQSHSWWTSFLAISLLANPILGLHYWVYLMKIWATTACKGDFFRYEWVLRWYVERSYATNLSSYLSIKPFGKSIRIWKKRW